MENQSRLNCLLIEDEPLAQKQITRLINDYNNLYLISVIEDIDQLNENLNKIINTDILFLDINIKGGDVRQLTPIFYKIRYIVVTSVLGENEIFDYLNIPSVYILRKPFTASQFKKCIEKINKTFNLQS